MAIEGIRSAVGSNYTSRQPQPSADIKVAAVGGNQVKVENAIPQVEEKSKNFNDPEQDKKKKEDEAAVQTEGK